jgi:hypothetical protein
MPATHDDMFLPFSLPSICQRKITAAFDGGGGKLLGIDHDGAPTPPAAALISECF